MSWVWDSVSKNISENTAEWIIGGIVFGILGWILKQTWAVIKTWWQRRRAFLKEIEHLEGVTAELDGRIQRTLNAVGKSGDGGNGREGQGLWLTTPIQQPSSYFMFQSGQCIPIWVFANLKGGVAKTTNAVNLAAHYACRGERVLLIDLDYQASASSMGLRDTVRIPTAGQSSRATRLIDGQYKPHELLDDAWAPTIGNDGMNQVANFRLIPSAYDLARAENRLMVEWLLGAIQDDIRYTLAHLLHHEETQASFDRIVIDAPPRLTSACVQALCASTHVVIPTVLDKLSVEAVQTFVDQVKLLKSGGICPHIGFGAVVGYQSGRSARQIPDAEELIFKTLRDADLSQELYKSGEAIPNNALLAESAGSMIAYLRSDKPQETEGVRSIYSALAQSIEDRISNHAS